MSAELLAEASAALQAALPPEGMQWLAVALADPTLRCHAQTLLDLAPTEPISLEVPVLAAPWLPWAELLRRPDMQALVQRLHFNGPEDDPMPNIIAEVMAVTMCCAVAQPEYDLRIADGGDGYATAGSGAFYVRPQVNPEYPGEENALEPWHFTVQLGASAYYRFASSAQDGPAYESGDDWRVPESGPPGTEHTGFGAECVAMLQRSLWRVVTPPATVLPAQGPL